jgi:hypothetical protein
MTSGAAQGVARRPGIVVEKVNEITARRLNGGIALDGGLLAAGDDHFELLVWIIQPLHRFERLDPALTGPRRHDDCHGWQLAAHLKTENWICTRCN